MKLLFIHAMSVDVSIKRLTKQKPPYYYRKYCAWATSEYKCSTKDAERSRRNNFIEIFIISRIKLSMLANAKLKSYDLVGRMVMFSFTGFTWHLAIVAIWKMWLTLATITHLTTHRPQSIGFRVLDHIASKAAQSHNLEYDSARKKSQSQQSRYLPTMKCAM